MVNMPALQTINLINPTHTQTSLVNAIKNAFSQISLGSLQAELTQGTNKILVYSVSLNNTYAFLQIKVTSSLAVTQQLFADWNSSNNTGISGGQESTSATFTSNAILEVRTFNSPDEFKLVALSQSTKYALLGCLRPETKHPNFDESIAPFIFQFSNGWNTPFVTWHSTGLSPYANAIYTSNMGNANLKQAHPISNKRDILAGMLLFNNAGQGIAGKTSDDIVSVASGGLNKFDSIQDPNGGNEYILLYPGNGSMAIRIDDSNQNGGSGSS